MRAVGQVRRYTARRDGRHAVSARDAPVPTREPGRRVLPRPVIVLGWVSFFTDVSSEMAYPLLPLFVVGVLGATPTALGGIEGAAQAAVAVLTAISGWRSDRSRRRVVFLRWGYGLPVLGKGLLAVAMAWPVVLVARGIDRIGKGWRASPRDALIADVVGAAQGGQAFGFHRAMDTAGALVGVVLSALLLWWHGDSGAPGAVFRIIFAISAILALVGLVLTFFVKDPLVPRETEDQGRVGSVPERGIGRRYWWALGMLVVFAIANSSAAFPLLRAGQVGLSPIAVVLAYALYNLMYALASYPAGVLSDRVGRWRMIAAGWMIYAAVYAGFAVTGSGGVWPLMALYGCSIAMSDGVAKALIADHARPEQRGSALGIMYLTLGLAALASSLLAGWLWETVGPAAPFWFGSGAAVASLLLLPALRPVLSIRTSATPCRSRSGTSRRRGRRGRRPR